MPIFRGGAAAAAGGMEYVDRGDPAAFDYRETDLTLDETWRDLDLSSIVTDSDAEVVHFLVLINDNATNQWFWLRKNGNTDTNNTSRINTYVTNANIANDWWCACDANQVVEYVGKAGTNAIYLIVRGWLKPA